ncbi:MAG TPA: outer membrane beta-barrel protein [Longimicrobiaceae bacterium]
MTRMTRMFAPALLLGAFVALPARAQGILPFSAEVRGGVALPQGDFNDGADTGWGIGGTLRYRIAPMVDVYAGYDRFSFGADSSSDFDEGVDVSIRDEGFRAGARFTFPLASTLTGLSPWVEGGATFNRTTLHASDGSASIDVNSDRSVGFEVGAGLNFAVAPRVSLSPGVRYRSHKASFDDAIDGGDGSDVDANYFVVEVGLSIHP